MELLLAWFTKFNTLFSLERLQEDMSKLIVAESDSTNFMSYVLIYVYVCERCGYIKKLLCKYKIKLLNKSFLPDCSS